MEGIALAGKYDRTPLEVLLMVMNNTGPGTITDRQLQCAIAAAP
jgi:hypothetical protein